MKDKGKILIIEDIPQYAISGVNTAISQGYQADVAFCLDQALDKLENNQYTGVLTDMCFEKNKLPKNTEALCGGKIEKLEREMGSIDIKKDFEAARTGYSTSRNLGDLNTVDNFNQGLLKDIEEKLEMDTQYHLVENTSNRAGTLYGQEVIKYCRDRDIPVVAVTSPGHAQGILYWLAHHDLTTIDEILEKGIPRQFREEEREKRMSLCYGVANYRGDMACAYDRDIQAYCDKRGISLEDFLVSELSSSIYGSSQEEREKYIKSVLSEPNEESRDYQIKRMALDLPVVLNKASLSGHGGKSPLTYKCALELLDGKTADEVRPYDIIDQN